MSTDGYANSYKSEEEFHSTVSEYFGLLKEHGVKAVSDSLPNRLTETSSMGCGDDITMLVAYFSQEDETTEESGNNKNDK